MVRAIRQTTRDTMRGTTTSRTGATIVATSPLYQTSPALGHNNRRDTPVEAGATSERPADAVR